jgi:flagellar FliL protein
MAAEEQSGEQKKGPSLIVKIWPILFGAINLGVMGAGTFLIYKNTLGWEPPVLTEEMLQAQLGLSHFDHRAPAASSAQTASAPRSPASVAPGPLSAHFVAKLDPFTVNLAGEPARMMETEINLRMLDESSFVEVLDPRLAPKLRDRVISVLRSKSFTELETMQGKLALKDQIVEEVNRLLQKGVVMDVYFTHFVVQ